MIDKALRVVDYVEHILGAITRIETYMHGVDRNAFFETTLVQDAVIRNFEIIGGAASNIRSVNPAYRMRNALIHSYDSVNHAIVLNTIQSDLPALKKQMEGLRHA